MDRQTGREIVAGSIAAVAAATGQTVAESFLAADVIVLVDTSASMAATDGQGRQQRYRVACDELAKLQGSAPGRIAVFAFSTGVEFAPGGIPRYIGGGTDLASALEFVLVADGTVRFIIISDGQPDDETGAFRAAERFKSRLDTIFVGDEADAHARNFLARLAKAHRGTHVLADRAKELAFAVQTLMLGAGS